MRESMRIRYWHAFVLAAAVLLGGHWVNAQSPTPPPLRLLDDGSMLPLRYRLNMVGTAVTCVDDPAHAQSVCTFTGGGGGGSGTVTSVAATVPGIMSIS